jgi:hypothetical protein
MENSDRSPDEGIRSERVERAQFVERDGEWLEGPRRLSSVAVYSPQGRMLLRTEIHYAEDGSLQSIAVRRGDGAGTPVDDMQYLADGTLNGGEAYAHDSEGRRIEERHYGPGGVPCSHVHQTYDGLGRLTHIVCRRDDGSLFLDVVIEYQGGGAQTRTARTYKLDGSFGSEDVTVSGPGGVLLERTRRGADGSLGEREEHRRDDQGNSEALYFGPDGALRRRVVRRCDAAGNAVETLVYDGAGSLTERGTREYNADGWETESVTYDGDGKVVSRWVALYDGDDLVETRSFGPEGCLERREAWVHDARGRVTEALEYGVDDVPESRRIWEWDDRDDWPCSTTFRWESGEGEPRWLRVERSYRAIDYYTR